MQILISNHTTKPIYEQITSQIKHAIMNGELKSGDPLPSMRALAKDLHISVITTQKAYEDLQRDGFIESAAGRGTFVSSQNKEFICEEQLRLAEAKLQEAAEIGRLNGISLETLTKLLTMFYDEGEGRSITMDALMLKNVSKAYENFQLKDISFTLPEGTIMGLIGENGAGKSTIINCIMDLVKRDSGEITVLGQQMDKDNLALREDIGIVFDVSDFYDSFSIEHTEKILQDVYKNWDHETFQRYKQQFALPDKKRMKEFSRGMKMKTAIAIALSHKPRLLILDEATSGLDPVMRDEILEVFMEFVQDEHHSILISSHISTDLEKVADYITFVHNGELVLSALKDELIYQYGIMKCREEDFKQLNPDDIIRYRKQPYETVVLVEDREAAAHNYPNCIVERATLDDIMLLYVKGERI